MVKEVRVRRAEIEGDVSTIYFGGGTPSVLEASELAQLLETVHENYSIEPYKEIEVTIEVNPEDVSEAKVNSWVEAGVNRVSLGVQSFDDADLKWMNRGHTADQAMESIELMQKAGIKNISADLIFGLPNRSLADWESNLAKMIDLGVPHISLYNLTIEPKTELAHQVKVGTTTVPEQEVSAQMFSKGRELLLNAGFDHYEISNYAKPGYISGHNSNYWKNVNYIGVGPSAHSYNGKIRRWNVANNQRYMRGVEEDETFWENEVLTKENRFNEYVMTGLRTKWGCDIDFIKDEFDIDLTKSDELQKQIENGHVIHEHPVIRLSEAGLLFADRIASDLFL